MMSASEMSARDLDKQSGQAIVPRVAWPTCREAGAQFGFQAVAQHLRQRYTDLDFGLSYGEQTAELDHPVSPSAAWFSRSLARRSRR